MKGVVYIGDTDSECMDQTCSVLPLKRNSNVLFSLYIGESSQDYSRIQDFEANVSLKMLNLEGDHNHSF